MEGVSFMAFEIYFQARLNDVHIASGYCQELESVRCPAWPAIRGICTEVRCWNGNAFIALSGVGLEVRYVISHIDPSIVTDGRILQPGETVNEKSFLVL